MKIPVWLISQFMRPRGVFGRVAGLIMERRSSNRERNRWAVSLLELEPDHRVLEIGFGPGFAIGLMSRLVTAGTVVGIDHSPEMVRFASRRNASAIRQGRVRLELRSAETIDDLEGTFDRVLAVNSSMFWREPEAVLSKIRERLEPRGRVVLVHQPRSSGATRETAMRASARTEAALRAAGFTSLLAQVLELKPVPVAAVIGETDAAAAAPRLSRFAGR